MIYGQKNKEVHDKEEVAKQQKRKAKAATRVWELHKLHDQARPSNAFLFYQDIKEEIKHAIAAKLEDFISMKIRPFTNSVSKWTERATCKVKSIVEWIKTGEKNHKEVIERLEKRYKDHFRHEEHKKPRKKMKGRDITVHSTLRQTSLSGFVSISTNMYWSLGGSYIYSNSNNLMICVALL